MRIVSGQFRNQTLFSPKGDLVRPTSEQVRAAIFNIAAPYIDGATLLDIFAGSGAIGFEALSRGAKSVTFIERNRLALQCIKKNSEKLGVEECAKIMGGDALKLIAKLISSGAQFNIIYVDPPYDNQLAYDSILEFLDNSNLLVNDGLLFVEERSKHIKEDGPLQTLVLKDSRRFGSTNIKQYRRKS